MSNEQMVFITLRKWVIIKRGCAYLKVAELKEELTKMIPITGLVRNGRIEIDAPIGCADGTEVRVWLETEARLPIEDAPQDIDATVRAMQEFEPVVMTAEEEFKFNHALQELREMELAIFDTQATKIESLFK
jgi:hypothetical protein